MYNNKKVLLIAGGGTLGTHTANELLRLGACVDVICPEEKVSTHNNLRFIQDYVSKELLEQLFSENYYNGIVNFIHYSNVEEYKDIYRFLIKRTDHLIFLSSYRVYADEQHPITESAPRVHEALKDEFFLTNDGYGVRKALCEDFLFNECNGQNWTIVRPVISFSKYRLDIVMNSGTEVLEKARSGQSLLLPQTVRNFTAGLDWAGNSGKLIANLLFKKDAIGQAFTVSSAQNYTWQQVADVYAKHMDIKIEWVSDEEYLNANPLVLNTDWRKIGWQYDRKFSREIDNSKILQVTGLKKEDFISIDEGVKIELEDLGFNKKR